MIFAIGDIDPALVVAGNIVDQIELSRIGTRLAPGEQQLAVRRILVNAGIGIAVGNVDVALRREGRMSAAVEWFSAECGGGLLRADPRS
jgi:hypothetical protein